jgi:hypothetical protein
MENLTNEKMIAYQTVDNEGDIWCNVALIFETMEEVELFFNNPRKVAEVLELEVYEEDGESYDNFITIHSDYAIEINLIYCGQKLIKKMSHGYFIKN